MPRQTDTRKRMLRTAAALLRRQGYAATGWRQVVAESATPWGSQAHHFPGGKEQLASEAVTEAGASYQRLLAAVLAGRHPGDAVADWTTFAGAALEASGWADGCPVATVALETAHTSDVLAAACAAAFNSWRDALGDSMVQHGATAEEAERLALVVLASIEGALLLSRAGRDGRPLLVVGEELRALLTSRLRDEQGEGYDGDPVGASVGLGVGGEHDGVDAVVAELAAEPLQVRDMGFVDGC